MKFPTSAVLVVLLVCGCQARQMNLSPPVLGVMDGPRRPPTEAEIVKAFDHRPTINPGSTVGVACLPMEASTNLSDPRPVITADLKSWQAVFQDNYFIIDVVQVSSTMGGGVTDIRYLRRNAATLNCDLLLVYGVSCDYSRMANPLAALYLTIIGTFFVPGDSVTAASMVRAALVDVRSGQVYGVVEATSEQTMVMPMVWIQGSLQQLYQNSTSAALKEARERMRPIVDRLRDQSVHVAE